MLEGPLKGILAYSEEALVKPGTSFPTPPASLTPGFTYVVGGNLVKVCGWYDNEWGYPNRAAQAMKKLGDSLGLRDALAASKFFRTTLALQLHDKSCRPPVSIFRLSWPVLPGGRGFIREGRNALLFYSLNQTI